MITSTQITSTVIFAFIAVLVLKLLNRKVAYQCKRQYRLLKSRLLANFTSKLLENYK